MVRKAGLGAPFVSTQIAIFMPFSIENRTFQGCFLEPSAYFSIESSGKRWQFCCNSPHEIPHFESAWGRSESIYNQYKSI